MKGKMNSNALAAISLKKSSDTQSSYDGVFFHKADLRGTYFLNALL
jgi:hypothetical protein